MTQTPAAGWYADPGTPPPGAVLRYWDGARWTEHVQPAPHLPPHSAAGAPGARQPTTPDGQRLAGWWQRVGAFVADYVVLTLVSAVLGWPFLRRVLDGYGDYVRAALRAAEDGAAAPSQSSLLDQVLLPTAGFVAVMLLVSLVYNAVFLRWRSATPGKLVFGLRVRLRERPGPLSWRTVLVRWAAQNAATLVAVVPVLSTIASVYPLLDSLWPLWDSGKQALHDKAARTNVVRVRD